MVLSLKLEPEKLYSVGIAAGENTKACRATCSPSGTLSVKYRVVASTLQLLSEDSSYQSAFAQLWLGSEHKGLWPGVCCMKSRLHRQVADPKRHEFA